MALPLAGCDGPDQQAGEEEVLHDTDGAATDTVDDATDASDDAPQADAGEIDVDEADAEPGPLILPSCEELLGSPPSPSGHQPGSHTTPEFSDVTARVGIPTMHGITASWGDINADGFIDLFVPGWTAEPTYRTAQSPERFDSIFFGCGAQFFEHRIALSGEVPPQSRGSVTVDASHIADMDGDGLQDLLVSIRGDLYVWHQTSHGFVSRKVWAHDGRHASIVDLTVADFNRDGLLDVYGSVYGSVNVLLEGTSTGRYLDHAFDNEDHAAASAIETFASAYIPRRDPDLLPLLYLAHHDQVDQVWLIGDDFGLELSIDNIPPGSSMGVDYYYPTSIPGVVAAISEEGSPHFIYVLSDDGSFREAQLDPIFPGHITEWGIRFSDFNNDGGMDLVYACAPTSSPDVPIEETLRYHMKLAVSAAEAGNTSEPLWRDVSATAGPSFDGSGSANYYGLGAADFNLDGCVDLVITPSRYESNNPGIVTYFGPITVLRNRCKYPGNWVGFLLEDPGALVSAAVTSDGELVHRWVDSQAGSSVAGESASEQLHIGLGQTDTIEGIDVRCQDGRTAHLDGSDLMLNSYNDIGHLCPRGAPQ